MSTNKTKYVARRPRRFKNVDPQKVKDIKIALSALHQQYKDELGHEPSYDEAKALSESSIFAPAFKALRDELDSLPPSLRRRILDVQILRNVQSSVGSKQRDRLIRALDFGPLLTAGATAVRGALVRNLPRLFAYGRQVVGNAFAKNTATGLKGGLVNGIKSLAKGAFSSANAKTIALGLGAGALGEKYVQSQTNDPSDPESDEDIVDYNQPTRSLGLLSRNIAVNQQKDYLLHNHLEGSYSLTAVDKKYVVASLCPELYMARKPMAYALATTLSKAMTSSTYATNASGALQLIVLPLNLFGTGASNTTAFTILRNDNSFNATTGIQGPNPTWSVGPLNGLISNVERFSLIGASINIIPITSNNTNQGSIQVVYFNGQFNPTFFLNGGPLQVTQQEMSNSKYYIDGGLGQPYRSVDLPEPGSEDVYYMTNNAEVSNTTLDPTDFGFIILVTGAATSIPVIRVDITYMCEFIPNSTTLPICPVEQASPGPATVSFIGALHRMYPCLQREGFEKIKQICNFIMASKSNDHDQLLCEINASHIITH